MGVLEFLIRGLGRRSGTRRGELLFRGGEEQTRIAERASLAARACASKAAARPPHSKKKVLRSVLLGVDFRSMGLALAEFEAL